MDEIQRQMKSDLAEIRAMMSEALNMMKILAAAHTGIATAADTLPTCESSDTTPLQLQQTLDACNETNVITPSYNYTPTVASQATDLPSLPRLPDPPDLFVLPELPNLPDLKDSFMGTNLMGWLASADQIPDTSVEWKVQLLVTTMEGPLLDLFRCYLTDTFINIYSIDALYLPPQEALVRFSGFGPEEDEWVNIRKHVRQRSLPCEPSECVAVLPGDLLLCFQEGKEQALYYDAHVLDAQRRRHDVRGCRCRFLVRCDHDQSEEIVPLRKICRRPETDYRLQQLHAESVDVNPQKISIDSQVGNNSSKINTSGSTTQNSAQA
ncbi:hypothetical protein BUALT_Bualt18G0046800 [Buddleja alternifolia]|uniref:SAWADEE domain-containing protein n=1 Tax=Buddleja alternifolia TaxID=168488 RepID=A0AAV6W8P3_9LAMI|nr:hypothetical protein BUALT_Bualt18G0046800 [Buddleja alternifolia]